MKNIKKHFGFEQWHICIVVILVLLVSVISWLRFINLVRHFDSQNENELDTNAFSSTEANDRISEEFSESNSLYEKSILLCNSIDNRIKGVGSQWNIVKKATLSKTDSILTYFLTGEIASTQVIKGKGKWLFFKSVTDESTFDDYEGKKLYSREELEDISHKALSVQNALKSKDIQYAILVAPNKENVYSRYMPEQFYHAEKSRTDYLVEYLSNNGVSIIWPQENLVNYSNNMQVYYSYDTHWNQLGAYIGVHDTLLSWNIVIPDLSDRSIKESSLYGNFHSSAEDDLAKMVGLRFVLSDEKEYEVDGSIQMDWSIFEQEQREQRVSHFHNDRAVYNKSIMLMGDSYRSAMIPCLRETFADVYVASKSIELVYEIEPDYVIDEYVERYSGTIGEDLYSGIL